MKTPEQMAEDWLLGRWYAVHDPTISGESKVAFLAGYKAAQQWISVKERLPEENDEVLIYTEGKHIYMARIYKGNEAYPISNGCGCCGSEERYTHWMPLPEPPKEER